MNGCIIPDNPLDTRNYQIKRLRNEIDKGGFMSNVISGKFGNMVDVPVYFLQSEDGEVAATVAMKLNKEIDKQGMCEVEIWHQADEDVWLIGYELPNGYYFSYSQTCFNSLAEATYFMVACHVASSDIKNKSVRCLTPFDPDEAEEQKLSIKYRIKKDIIGVPKKTKRKSKKSKK